MAEFAEFPLEGGSILVEARRTEARPVTRSSRDVVTASAEPFEQAVKSVRPLAQSVLSAMRDATPRPHEITITFGFSLSATGKVVVVSGTAEANFAVTLTWRSEREAADAGNR